MMFPFMGIKNTGGEIDLLEEYGSYSEHSIMLGIIIQRGTEVWNAE